MLFPVRPDVLDRIEFRRIGGQVVDFDHAVLGVDIFRDEFAAVSREPVPHNQQWIGDMASQADQEIRYLRTFNAAGIELEVEPAETQPRDG